MADAVALPAPQQPRRRELLFGTAFATAGVVAVMATLIGYYLAARNAGGADWFAANNIPLTQPNMQALTLAMSVITMQWAVYSIARDDRGHTYLALGVTLLLGAAFVNQTTFLYKQAAVVLDQAEGPLFYAVTGGSLAMVVAGMIFIALMAFRALGGQFSSRQPDGIAAAAVFWYASVAVYAVVWVAVYVMK
ncbi:cytochrome c oxidase subunit 3 [Dermatobacter hominis]|uniref:cytochrome c oxidase subunit 3 n=1 Tax=Dermatobacter hominis TaxID=2884263 RepID=UPI001D11077C|nr:cytochrome c oxidase subunit 3 [Dermatobacter hominis]UDY34077.1 cytochrome c oxidase subunit 3 [Dermatobacter hominis]